MQVEIDADNIHKGKIDAQGRKYITRELSGKKVTVAVIEVHDDE